MPRPAVLTIGEALIDWLSTQRGATLDKADRFVKAPGGAPLNVAVGLARLGVSVGFVGCVGDEPFGRYLKDVLEAEGVDVEALRLVSGCETRMAYIVTRADGERELAAFSRQAVADAALGGKDLAPERLEAAEALVFGLLVQRSGTAREALLPAMAAARDKGRLVLFDPNVRPVLWPDRAELREVLARSLGSATIAKLSDDELGYVLDEPDAAAAARAVRERYGLAAVVVTHGAAGASWFTAATSGHVASPAVAVEDPTGAGDAFVAGLVWALRGLSGASDWHARLAGLAEADWQACLRRACAVGALATTRSGATAGLPTAPALERFLGARS